MFQPRFVSYITKNTRIFFRQETSSGIVMLLCAVLAMGVANSPLSEKYFEFINTTLSFTFGTFSFSAAFDYIVKDILMVFFFFKVGMELKKEMVDGFLTKASQIISPLIAALCGMIVPALIYILINVEYPQNWHGWAIPCATDIAFAVCVLVLAGKNINPTVKIFLLAIAVFDDIGSIIIIALFYSSDFVASPLLFSMLIIAGFIILNRLQIASFFFYGILGILLWETFHLAGISTSIAGVITGLFIPFKSKINQNETLYPINDNLRLFTPWVNFMILPIFAFVEAGVNLSTFTVADFLSPISLGVAVGLFLGKQIGIFGSALLLIKLGFCQFPKAVKIRHIYGVSVLSGIGFTMSLFVSKLAFNDVHMLEMAKIGIIISAVFAIIFGFLVLRLPTKNKKNN